MRKCVLWGIMSSLVVLSMASLVWAEDEYVVTNPNYEAYITAHPLETKPRDAAVIAAEKKLIVEAAQAVVDYAKANGVEQAAAEVTKGVNGAFANYNIGPQFRIGLYQFTDTGPNGEVGDFVIIKGHNLFLNLVGVPIPVDMFADLSGWKFVLEWRKAVFSPQGRGWMTNIIWPDEFWAGGKAGRANTYVQLIDKAQGMCVGVGIHLDE